jgi:MFS family permease
MPSGGRSALRTARPARSEWGRRFRTDRGGRDLVSTGENVERKRSLMPSLGDVVRSAIARVGMARGDAREIDPLTPDEDYNSKLLAAEAPLGIMASGALANFYALFAIQSGFSNALVGWLSSGPALLNLFWVIPSGRLIQRSANFAHPMAAGALGQRLVVISMALIPFLPAPWQSWGLVGLVTLASMPDAMRWLSLQAACGEMFQPHHMARAMGRRWATMSVCTVAITPLLGKFVDWLPFPTNFQWLFAGVGVITLGTLWFLLRLRLPPREMEEPPAAGRTRLLSRASWREIRRHRSFVLYELGMLVLQMAALGAAPLYRIYWVRDLGATGSWVGALAAAGAVGGTAGNLLWGKWSRPDRDRRNTLITCLGTVSLYPLLTAAFGVLPAQLGVALLSGFFTGGNGLMLFNRTVQASPRRQRPTFLAIHSITSNVAGFVAPLVTAGLADALSTRGALLVVAALGVAASALIFLIGWGELPAEDAPATQKVEQAADR